MTELVRSGIDEIGLAPGSHVCAFYRGDRDRDRLLSGYLAAGLSAGDKCICVVDSASTAESLQAFLARTVLPEPPEGQLDIYLPETTYLAGGEFTTGDMLTFWTENMAKAEIEGYTFCRMAGEMTWALRNVPGTGYLAGYESELNRLTASHPVTVLCLYDLDRFGGETVVNTVKTHPQVLVQGILIDNPYYVAPDEFLATFTPHAAGQRPEEPAADAVRPPASPPAADAGVVAAVLRSAGL
ncbi:MAG TPA: MEDS domain-containing protein [Trebonia sp.]|nr:MEDS domain-containing protein [Trebonia sp.]